MDVITSIERKKLNLPKSDTIEKSEISDLFKRGLIHIYPLEMMQRYIDDMHREAAKKRESERVPFKKALLDELSTFQEHICEGKTIYIQFKDSIQKSETQANNKTIIKSIKSKVMDMDEMKQEIIAKKNARIKAISDNFTNASDIVEKALTVEEFEAKYQNVTIFDEAEINNIEKSMKNDFGHSDTLLRRKTEEFAEQLEKINVVIESGVKTVYVAKNKE